MSEPRLKFDTDPREETPEPDPELVQALSRAMALRAGEGLGHGVDLRLLQLGPAQLGASYDRWTYPDAGHQGTLNLGFEF